MPGYGADGAPTELLMRGCSSPDADGKPALFLSPAHSTKHARTMVSPLLAM